MQCIGAIFLLGGGNLMRSNFDHSENCYLVRGGMNLWWGRNKNVVGRESTGGWEFLLVGGGVIKFSASGEGLPSRENPDDTFNLVIRLLLFERLPHFS